MGYRVVRTAGDEKVYVSQALEMARDGRWFVQTLMDKPDYYKGPLHYLFLRAGMAVVGLQTWASVYMNWIFLVLGALALASVVARRLPKWEGGPVFVGSFFALNVGLFSHAFASQMEIELASIFAFSLYFLDRLEPLEPGFAFWIMAGLAGWVKSPLHSVFIGVSGILFWLMQGELWKRLKSPMCWLAVVAGVAFCVLGYVPAYLGDTENFMKLYIYKETVYKSLSGQPWTTPLASTFGFYLLPWMLLAIVSYAQIIFRAREFFRDKALRRLMALSIASFAPNVVFFIYHPYRFENYDLPVISGVILLVSVAWAAADARWKRWYAASFLVLAVVVVIAVVGIVVIPLHFGSMPSWWPAGLPWAAAVAGLYAAWILVRFGFQGLGSRPDRIALGSVGFFVMAGLMMSVLGERELVDLRRIIAREESQGRPLKLSYYNIQHNIWSEWGLLSLWIQRPVVSIHTDARLKEALLAKETILVPAGDFLMELRAFAQKETPGVALDVEAWKRWRTHGATESGKPLWREAWDKRDISLLERDFYIVHPR